MDENALVGQNQNQNIPSAPQGGVSGTLGQTPVQQGTPLPTVQTASQTSVNSSPIPVSSDIFSAQQMPSVPQPISVQQAVGQSPQVVQLIPQSVVQEPVAQIPPTVSQTEEPTKITLDDLYGPSTQDERENLVVSQHIQSTGMPPETSFQPPSSEVSVSQPPPMPDSMPPLEKYSPVQPTMSSTQQEEVSSSSNEDSSGGFKFPPILKFLIGVGVVLLIGAVLVSFLSGLFHQSNSGKVTLTYWGLWEDTGVMQGVISDFERMHPNVSITYIKQDPNKYTDRLLTRIQNGTGPDIFRYHNSWVTPLKGVLLPLPQNVLSSTVLQKNYPPVVTQDLVKNGAILGLPLDIDTLSLFVNKDIFDHAGASVPTTWDQFITVAKALTVKDSSGKIKTAGAAMGTFDNIDHAPDIVSLLLLQNGANLQKLSGSQNAVDALTFYTSFANSDSSVWDSTLDNSTIAFARGQLAMFFGYSWDILAIKAVSPTLNFTVYPVPHLPGRDMTIASYWVEGISNRSKHQKESAEFLAYLAQKDTQTKLYTDEAKSRQFGELYAPSDLAESLASNPLLAPFVSQAGKAVSTFFVGATQYDAFNGSLNGYLGNAVSSVLGNTSIDTAMTTLAQGVSQVFNQYVQPSP